MVPAAMGEIDQKEEPRAFAEQGRWGCLRDTLWKTDVLFVSTESRKCSLERILMKGLQTLVILLNRQRVAGEYI